MKPGIIVSGHGHFATGICSSLDLIMGIPDNMKCIDFPSGDNIVHLEKEFDEALDEFKGREVIVFVDLFSGSPFNVAMRRAMNDPRIHLYYGTNLGMLMEASSKSQFNDDVSVIMDGLVQTGKDQVGLFDPSSVSQDEDDGEEEEDL